MPELALGRNVTFHDLYTRTGLMTLHEDFISELRRMAPDAHRLYLEAHASAQPLESKLLMELARHLEAYLLEVFPIQEAYGFVQEAFLAATAIPLCKQQFLRRRVLKTYSEKDLQGLNIEKVERDLQQAMEGVPFSELAFARCVNRWMRAGATYQKELGLAGLYAAWAMLSPAGQARHRSGTLFHLPQTLDYASLIPHQTQNGRWEGVEVTPREGFDLVDQGISTEGASDQLAYCLKCHNRGKDTCRKGIRHSDDAKNLKQNPIGNRLEGCPLEQKISEMAALMETGHLLAAFAVVVLDNPMVAGTGHRICNACEKACIFQKQTPVDIPNVETRLLKDILFLPWGFEIYNLLTKWNPLNMEAPYPSEPTGRSVLVVGMGPAGYTLAHFLLNQGHTVYGIDGLKIDPLPVALRDHAPIEHIKDHFEPLGARQRYGFGGVAEYGITSRWDKNFLLVIRLLLERRERFTLQGSVLFGRGITVLQAIEYGIDHIALATGAGKPRIDSMPNMLAPGVRMAVDFLMALNLLNVGHPHSLGNMVIRLPLVVVGAGLTGIDAATEALAYYPLQVATFYDRYMTLVARFGKEQVEAAWSPLDHQIASEFLAHADALRKAPSTEAWVQLLQSWGGVTLVYRKFLEQSPGYRINHKELEHALQQGIWCQPMVEVEGFDVSVTQGQYWVSGVICKTKLAPEVQRLEARSVLMATGTKPNTVLADFEPDLFQTTRDFFSFIPSADDALDAAFLVGQVGEVKISACGDLHPEYYGSVVHAMASAKKLAPKINQWLHDEGHAKTDAKVFHSLLSDLIAIIKSIKKIKGGVRITVHAPQLAHNYQEGMTYKLQRYDLGAGHDQQSYVMEGIALSPKTVDQAKGLLVFEVMEKGASSYYAQDLQVGEKIALMGPTGRGGYDSQVYVPMQCMMQGVCGQCLMTTKSGGIFYGCAGKCPEQTFESSLAEGRLQQNSVQEKVADLWLRSEKSQS